MRIVHEIVSHHATGVFYQWRPIMLVLRRKIGERIFVGDDVVITLIKVGTGSARIGVDAPPGTAILREEIAGRDPAAARVPFDVDDATTITEGSTV